MCVFGVSSTCVWSVYCGVFLCFVVCVVFRVARLCLFFGGVTLSIVSVPERSKGVDSSSTVFALVGSNPTADTIYSFYTSQLRHYTHLMLYDHAVLPSTHHTPDLDTYLLPDPSTQQHTHHSTRVHTHAQSCSPSAILQWCIEF